MNHATTQPKQAALIELGQQTTVRRNWRFNLLPGLITLIALLALIWEVIRVNVGGSNLPWTIQLLPIPSAVNIATVFGALVLARMQYARSVRPSLGWSAQLADSTLMTGSAWTVNLMNAGPSLAEVTMVSYYVEVDTLDSGTRTRSGSQSDATQFLERFGLRSGVDFQLLLLTRNAPLLVAKSPKEALEFAAFSLPALKILKEIWFCVRVIDIVGDEHEKWLPLMATVPNNLLNTVTRKETPNEAPNH